MNVKIKTAVVAAVIACSAAFAAHGAGRAASTEETKAKLLKSAQQLSRLGGLVGKPGKGKLSLISSQRTYDAGELAGMARLFGGQLHFPMTVVESPEPANAGNASSVLGKTGSNVGIFLVDDEAMPLSVVAMEERWAIVNAAKVAKGAAGKDAKVRRLQREISRVLKAIFLNGSDGKNVEAVRVASDLEKIKKDPIDGQQLFTMVRGLPSYGLVAPKVVPYKKACQEGWAPAPTNDVQQAIWNEVHAIPDKPLTIEFDPKKDKGK